MPRTLPTLLIIGALALAASACAPGASAPTPQAGAAARAGTGGPGAQAGAQGGRQQRGGAPTRPGAAGLGDLNRVSGTVQIVMPEGVWLTDGKNFGLTQATRVTRGTAKQVSDLSAGALVNITSERLPDGTLQASEIGLLPAPQAANPQAQQGGAAVPGQAGQRGQGAQTGQAPGAATQRAGTQGAAAADQQAPDPSAAPSGGRRGGQGGAGATGAGGRGLQGERTLADGTVVVTGVIASVEEGSLVVTVGDTEVQLSLTDDTSVMLREQAAVTDLVAGVAITALLSDGDAVMVNLQ